MIQLTMNETAFELEYNYIKETIQQSIGDRYRFLNFYIAISTAVGTAIAGLVSLDGVNFSQTTFGVISILSLGLFGVGLIFLLMMIRIRQVWYEAVIAINDLKVSNLTKTQNSKLPWHHHNIPKPEKLWNIHFYASFLIILISSLFLGTGVSLILDSSLQDIKTLLFAIALGLVNTLLQIRYYIFALKNDR